MEFKTLNLNEAMLDNLNDLGFSSMTPIQAESLPVILEAKDIIAQAKTGSGKTAAFGIGLLHKLKVKEFRVQSLVLCPTRELADQVAKELRRLARTTHNIKILTLTGGMPYGPQLGSLKHGAHIIVGTPGRVLKHLTKKNLVLDHLETLVLDEADRMLDMGFIEEIQELISFAPKQRQTLLFSATYPKEIMSLSSDIQIDAVNIQTISHDSEVFIDESFYQVPEEEKNETLLKLLAKHKPETAIVFTNTKRNASDIADALQNYHIDALALHGDLEQMDRTDVLTQFSNHSCSVLVATDVAARGIDIKDMPMVINYELPRDRDVYTHRIGRTGRAGTKGVACTLYDDYEQDEALEYQSDTRRFDDYTKLADAYEFEMHPLNKTLIIDGGKKDKVRAGDVLGALTGAAGIEGKYIGKIDIYDRTSYVAIHKDYIDKAHKNLKRGEIKGRSFRVGILK
jgi:ATP-dependent RNA helicase DbpA